MPQVASPRHMRAGFHVQHHIGWQLRAVVEPLSSNHRGECREFFRLAIRTWFRIEIRRLHHHVGFMVREPAVDRADQRHLVEHRRLERKILANLHTRDGRGNRLKRAANFNRCRRLQIPGVDMARSACHPDQDHTLLTDRGLTGSHLAGFHQTRERQAAHPRQTRLQHAASTMNRDTFPFPRPQRRKGMI